MSQALPHGLDTSVTKEELVEIGKAYVSVPEGFSMHPRVAPVAQKRAESVIEGGIDWS